jgi:hypothetical protein
MDEKNTKEVNLLDLIKMFNAWVVKVSKSFINFILYLLKAGYRKKYLTLTLIVLCFAIGNTWLDQVTDNIQQKLWPPCTELMLSP